MATKSSFLSGKGSVRMFHELNQQKEGRPRGYFRFLQNYCFTIYAESMPQDASVTLFLYPEDVSGEVCVADKFASMVVNIVEGSRMVINEQEGREYVEAVIEDLKGFRFTGEAEKVSVLPCTGDMIDLMYEKPLSQSGRRVIEGRIMSAIGQDTGWVFREFVTEERFM